MDNNYNNQNYGYENAGSSGAGNGYNATERTAAGNGYNATERTAAGNGYNATERTDAGNGYNTTERTDAGNGYNATERTAAENGYSATGSIGAENRYNTVENTNHSYTAMGSTGTETGYNTTGNTGTNSSYTAAGNAGASNDNRYSRNPYWTDNVHSAYRESSYYNPYQQPSGMQQAPKKPKKKAGFAALLGKSVAVALIFGLVAGGTFSGVTYMANRSLGFLESNKDGEDSKKNLSHDKEDGLGLDKDSVSSLQQTATGEAKELQAVSSIVQEVMPSIVAITNIGTVTYNTFWGPQEYESSSCGSGIIVRQDDDYFYIVTNNHVVEGADTLTVQFSDDSTASCEVKGSDPSDDLAVVKVEKKSIEKETLKTIKIATIGDSEALLVGEGAIAIGNALGYGQSVSVGYISALGRTVTVQDPTTGKTIMNNNMIQTDAAINPGNSGGALLNAKGEVIGINSVKYSDEQVEGFGFAIPMADAMPIVDQLITREKVEKEQSAYLGIQGQNISADMAETYNMPQGIYVYKTIADSAAAQAGIRQGDIITAFDGQSVLTMEDLKELLTYYKAGQKVTLKVYRLDDGYQASDVEVTLGSANGYVN